MSETDLLEFTGLDRAISISSKGKNHSESESIVLDQVNEFGLDSVYFNTDENGNSFPAVFLKRVKDFDVFMSICKKAAKIHGNKFSYTLLESSDIK
jgi:hypothetical protein